MRMVTDKQAQALAELYVWGAVIEIMEGSTSPRSRSGQKAATRIVQTAKRECQKLIAEYDSNAGQAALNREEG